MQRERIASLTIIGLLFASQTLAVTAIDSEAKNHLVRRDLSLVREEEFDQPKDNLIQPIPTDCTVACSFNVQMSMQAKADAAATTKILQIRGCKDETFHLAGCTDTGAAAESCVAQGSPGGVRVLKNTKNAVVGFGSCCSDSNGDKILQTTTAMCQAPATPAPAAVPAKANTNAPNTAAAAANTTTSWEEAPATNSSWFPTIGLPTSVTSIGQGIVVLGEKHKSQTLFIAMSSMTLVSVSCTAWLMYAHSQSGLQASATDSATQPSHNIYGLLWAAPVLAILAMVSAIMPELSIVWQFLQALLFAAALRKMPTIFLQAGGGQLQLQRGLQEQEREDRVSTLNVFTQLPFCCMRACIPPKKLTASDLSLLHNGVSLICFLIPCLSLTEMIIGLEATFVDAKTSLVVAPVVATSIRVVEVLLIAMAMAAIRGLEVLVVSINPNAGAYCLLGRKQAYCQCFCAGMRLLPIIVHLFQVMAGEGALFYSNTGDTARSILICTAGFICATISLRAFPAAAGKRQSGAMIQKPVLEKVNFCPVCGSSSLELQTDGAAGDTASCPECLARHIPLHLVVHRGTVQGPPAQTKSAPVIEEATDRDFGGASSASALQGLSRLAADHDKQ